ncbi:MAG: tetratricopeptide repeat protein, partial [Candidatus Aminicenantes bacterium]|nr:tetratricopeptide repeat protein [Candidatus Aminicenantes bacterium]
PEMTPARVGLAQIYAARGEKERAFLQYREILKIDPDDGWARPRLEALRETLTRGLFEEAAAAGKAGRTEAARTAFLKVLFYDPDSSAAHYELGRSYLREDNVDSALFHLQAFLEKDTGKKERRIEVLRDVAEAHFRGQEFGRSLEYFEKIRDLDPADQDALRRIDELKARLGVYELPSQYASIPASEAVAREDLAALVGVKFKDQLEGPGRRTRIVVDIATSWAQNYIVDVASLDIMGVYDNHTFQPRRIINRAELAETAVRLIRALQARGRRFVPLVEARRIQIADVTPENYFYPVIVEALSYQVMALDPMRKFEPERTVSGREAIRVLDIILSLAR